MVVGALTPTGQADLAAVARWRDAAGTATLVFHRAIDATPDPCQGLVLKALLAEREIGRAHV
mgnify:CR=1 FL=1